MAKVTFDYSKTAQFISADEVNSMKKLALDAKETLVSKNGAGNDFLGWIDLPVNYDKEEFDRIFFRGFFFCSLLRRRGGFFCSSGFFCGKGYKSVLQGIVEIISNHIGYLFQSAVYINKMTKQNINYAKKD